MAVQQKKLIRSNKAQILYLCQYMAQDPVFAAGDFKTPQGAAAMERQWQSLKVALDELGPDRTVEQWKICWRDQKRKARVEGGATTRAINATGNSIEVPELSENAALVLGTIGVGMATGFGPEESPIGSIVPASSQPTPPPRETPPSSSPPPPPPPPPPTARKSRVRKANPPDRFLKAQNEHNNLLREILGELRRSNSLRQEQNNIMKRSIMRKK